MNTLPPQRKRARRLWWLLLLLAALVVACWLERERLAGLPNVAARRYLANRQLDEARWWLDLSKRVSSTNPEAEFLLARICRRQGLMDQARQHLRRARHLGHAAEDVEREEWLAAAQSGQMQIADPRLATLLQDPRGDAAEICEAYVIGYLKVRRVPAAMDLIYAWRRDYPDDAQPLFWAGQIYRDLKALDKAEPLLRYALERDPSHAGAALALAEVLLETKRPGEAVEFFEIARADPHQNVVASLGLAGCWHDLGQTPAAVELLDEILARDPALAEALVQRANIDIELGDYAAAEQRLRPAIERNERLHTLRFAYGTALRGLGRLDEAQSHFEYSTHAAKQIALADDLVVELAETPFDAQRRFEIGKLHLDYGSAKEGLIWLLSVLNYDPWHRPTHEALAEYYQSKASESASYAVLAQQHRRIASGGGESD